MEKKDPLYTVGMQYGALTMKNGMEGLQIKLKTELPYDPVTFEETQNTSLKENMHPCVCLQHHLQSPRYGSNPTVYQ